MIKLTKRQIQDKLAFIKEYSFAANAASGSKVDANANVTTKNLATLQAELYKDFTIQLNRLLITEKLETRFGQEVAEGYVRDLEKHLLYTHDESSINPYCVSISMYPFLTDGLTGLGGESTAPKNLESFIGSFVNLVFAISSQFAGAVATVEFLPYLDHFARKSLGSDYLDNPEWTKFLEQKFQHVVYCLNQPAAARGYQSVFWNISIFDKNFFEGLFGDFYFPDGSKMEWESLDKLQRRFVEWFREERQKALLTFPVITLSALTEGDTWKDHDYLTWAADEFAKGSEVFIYTSNTVDSLASCCRLRNALQENQFSYSLGAGGVMTGSKNVITINLNRLLQTEEVLEDVIARVHKYQVAHDLLYQDFYEAGLLTVYSAGFIDLKKQFLTLGLNGVTEAAEFLGYEISNNSAYTNWLKGILSVFKEMNSEAGKLYGVRFNTEVVPAENLGVKNAQWDRKDGLQVNRNCYNSYFYLAEDDTLTIFDKMQLHGGEILKNLDGGSALHFNNDERLSPPQYIRVMESLAATGSNYFCENVPKSCCNSCGYIHPNHVPVCPKCGGTDLDYAVRVIGYLKRINNFSEARQKEAVKRHYHELSSAL